jgi:hypothetical protein
MKKFWLFIWKKNFGAEYKLLAIFVIVRLAALATVSFITTTPYLIVVLFYIQTVFLLSAEI